MFFIAGLKCGMHLIMSIIFGKLIVYLFFEAVLKYLCVFCGGRVIGFVIIVVE